MPGNRLTWREDLIVGYLEPEWPPGVAGERIDDAVDDLHHDWRAFARAVETASLAVVALQQLGGATWNEFVRFRSARPAAPTVLVTPGTDINARRLKDVIVHDVVFEHDIEHHLIPALDKLRRRMLLALVAERISQETRIDPDLAATLVRACGLAAPPRTTHALVRILGHGRDAFYDRWRAAGFPESVQPRLFVDWLLVAHAERVRARTCASWRCIAVGLHVKPETLANAVQRITGAALEPRTELDRQELLNRISRILHLRQD